MDGRDDNALGQRQGTHRRTPLGQIGETYLLECCGEKRPWAEDARLELKTGGAFLTVHEYVPVVHPWLTGMRDRILEVQSKLRSHSAPWPPETNLAVFRALFNADLGFDDAKGWTKWHEKPRERPPGATPGHVGDGKEEERNRLAMERALASVWSVEGVSKYTSEDCIGGQLCQKILVLLQDNHASIRTQHLVTIGAKYTAVMDGKGIPARDNLNVDPTPFGR
ncbi:hypothetical protein MCOR04_000750 [Pyricularia oryzae]|nr:hypothetical protein MCOR04_000750 [Pyricularia oryzae]